MEEIYSDDSEQILLFLKALLICFRLQDSKIVVVNNTAAATLRQLVIFVFDKVIKEDNEEPSENEPKHGKGIVCKKGWP